MALLPMPHGARYAAVELDEGGRVRRIAGKFGPGGEGLTGWHFPGLHALSPALLDRIPATPFACDLHRDLYPPLMARGLVRGLVTSGAWSDLGEPASYLAANLEAAAGGWRPERFGLEAPPPRIAPDARIDPAASVDARSVIGARCRVPAGARVEGSVLWDDTALEPGEQLIGAVAAGALRVR
jgi:mannose-1-phosphate guanylyltransferase